MLKHTHEIRVRYADTDKMQFVYNGKYLEYFEVGRTELLRNYGLPYSKVEEAGYQLPLISAHVDYKHPGKYDDLLLVTAAVEKLNSPKVHIDYSIVRKSNGDLVAEGYTEHLFIKESTKKAVRPPKFYVEKLAPYFEEK